METQNRNVTWDIVKGIAIVLMIIGHAELQDDNVVKRLIYSFHMPLFFIASGYFFSLKSPQLLLVKDIKHLLRPLLYMFIICTLYGIVKSISLSSISPLLYWTNIERNGYWGAMWFLPALLLVRFVVNGFACWIKHDIKFYCITLVFMLFGLHESIEFYNNPPETLSVMVQVFGGGIFYVIGIIISKYRLFQVIIKKKYIVLLLCLSVVIALKFPLDMRFLHYPNLSFDIIGAVIGTYLIYVFSIHISDNPTVGRFLALIGRYSLFILFVHSIDYKLIPFKTIFMATTNNENLLAICQTVARLFFVIVMLKLYINSNTLSKLLKI